MGPFVPDMISNELSLVLAILIGIAFGFVLEQAGFSSSRKLAGLFYGNDFTVLRVFFSAAVTAMLGIMFLSQFGFLDAEIIYINPTFVWSAIVGGLIMGLGFILGGYCPGTSICGAAIGKIDAMFFIGGLFIGVLIFGEIYPIVEPIYSGYDMGDVKVFETLGITQDMFAFILIGVALAAFFVTSGIERRVNKGYNVYKISNMHYAAAGIVVILGLYFLFTPGREEKMYADAAKLVSTAEIKTVTPVALTYRLIKYDKNLTVVDVRESLKYNEYNIPTSVNIPLDSILNREWREFFEKNTKEIIFYSEKEKDARKAAILAGEIGTGINIVLEGGLAKFREEILSPESYNIAGIQGEFKNRFLRDAAMKLEEVRKNSEKVVKPKKNVIKVSGGC